MELTQCINYLLTTSQHTVFQFLSGKLAEYDLTPSQYGVLSCLWQREFATPKQISEILCLETSTISGVLDRMQKKGLIDRVIIIPIASVHKNVAAVNLIKKTIFRKIE